MWELFVLSYQYRANALAEGVGAWIGKHGLNILIIFLVAYILRHFGAHLISKIIHRTVRHDLFPTEASRKKRIQTLDSVVVAVTRLAVWLIAATMLINELGINTAPLLASAGVIGLAIGVGAQSLIKDFVSGIFIITENQYRVGDVVQLNDVAGIVESITIRTTVLRDLDGNLHHIPNGTITVTTNKTIGFSSINEDITVNFDTDIAKLEHIINHVGQQVAAKAELKSKIIETPHFERIVGFSQSGIVIKVLGKTIEGEQWNIKGELYKQLKHAFDQHDIGIMPATKIAVQSNHTAIQK